MKKYHILILVCIAISITLLISYTGDLSSYETIASAKQKKGRFVNLIAKIDKRVPMEYNPAKDANYLAFTAIDTLGDVVKVVYHNTKPTDMEKSERVVLKGRMENDRFECKDILLKCPSKYKDNTQDAAENLREQSAPSNMEYMSAKDIKKQNRL